jgi:uracil-DNA glycosylase
MSDAYQQLLDSAIDHLQSLKAQGVRFVSVAPESLAALNEAPRAMLSTPAIASPAPVRPPQRIVSPPAVPITTPVQVAPVSAGVATISLPPALPAVSNPALSPEAKVAAFEDLRRRALACVQCSHLAASRHNVVVGVGNTNAEIMFVGEAPGADEDEAGEPFVGKAGQLLTKIIQAMGLSRDSVYIANILKCRPDTPGESAGNRKPTPEEMQTCIPFLHEQIDLIRPRILIALGATAVEGLLGKTVGITKLRGNWQNYRGIPLMPTYHPAYLLRNQAMSEKRRVWEDMLQVMEKTGMPISEKQRNFFLKAAG